MFILYIRNSLYLKKIVIIVFWLPHKIRKSNFCGKRGKRWKGEKYVSEAGEYSTGGFLSNLASRAFGPSNEDYLWEIQYRIIVDLAQKGPCVIVGRCADYILGDKADCLKVFIHADMDFRAKRIVEVYGERDISPEQRLKDKDKRRAAYHRFYTNMKWGHAQNYHITLNSGVLGIDKCADIIIGLY